MGRMTMFLEILVPQAHDGPVGPARNFPAAYLRLAAYSIFARCSPNTSRRPSRLLVNYRK